MRKKKSTIPIWLIILDIPAVLLALLIKVVLAKVGTFLLILIALFNALMIFLRIKRNKRAQEKNLQEIAAAVNNQTATPKLDTQSDGLSDMKLF